MTAYKDFAKCIESAAEAVAIRHFGWDRVNDQFEVMNFAREAGKKHLNHLDTIKSDLDVSVTKEIIVEIIDCAIGYGIKELVCPQSFDNLKKLRAFCTAK